MYQTRVQIMLEAPQKNRKIGQTSFFVIPQKNVIPHLTGSSDQYWPDFLFIDLDRRFVFIHLFLFLFQGGVSFPGFVFADILSSGPLFIKRHRLD